MGLVDKFYQNYPISDAMKMCSAVLVITCRNTYRKTDVWNVIGTISHLFFFKLATKKGHMCFECNLLVLLFIRHNELNAVQNFAAATSWLISPRSAVSTRPPSRQYALLHELRLCHLYVALFCLDADSVTCRR